MTVYYCERFKKEFDTLIKKNSYKDIELVLYNYLTSGTYIDVKGGDIIYGPPHVQFYKKRIPDAGGYRLYYLAVDDSESFYLSFIHPKTGSLGYENINQKMKKLIHSEILILRSKSLDLYKLEFDHKTKKINFIKK